VATICLFFTSFHCPQLFFCPPAQSLFRRPCISVETLKVLKTEKRLQLVATNPGWQTKSHLCS